MDPVLAGLLANAAYGVASGAFARSREESLDDRMEAAAETVADGRDFRATDLTRITLLK